MRYSSCPKGDNGNTNFGSVHQKNVGINILAENHLVKVNLSFYAIQAPRGRGNIVPTYS
jgi:hypothetical protein